MGIVKGLNAMNRAMEHSGPTGSGGEKARWLKVDDGKSVKIRFLQELDADSPNYDNRAGEAILAVEHTNPKDYRRKALCSMDDQGRCFGCEMHRRDMKAGWKGRTRMYVNVLVDDGSEDPYVAIFSQGMGGKSATHEIIQYAGETGSITNVLWRLKRSGEKTETSYSIIPLPSDVKINVGDYELYDLEKVAVRDVPYAEQENFYMGVTSDTSAESSNSSSVEW